MNTIEYVKLTADTNFIPVKYAVMEATVGSSLGNSYIWLKCIGQGVASQADLTALKTAIGKYEAYDKTKVIGTLGSYLVTSIDKITPYASPARCFDADLLLG